MVLSHQIGIYWRPDIICPLCQGKEVYEFTRQRLIKCMNRQIWNPKTHAYQSCTYQVLSIGMGLMPKFVARNGFNFVRPRNIDQEKFRIKHL